MTVSLPDGWRPIQPSDAPAVAALIDADEVAAGFRSRIGSEDIADWASRANLATDSWLHEEEKGRLVAAGGGQVHAGAYFARGCVHPAAKGQGLGARLVDLSEAPPAPELPDGLALETFRDRDARDWYAAANEIF